MPTRRSVALLGLAMLVPGTSAFARASSPALRSLRELSCNSYGAGKPGMTDTTEAFSQFQKATEVETHEPELRARPRWHLPVAYVPATENGEIRRLTGIVERLCNAIISADDVALSEREAGKIGRVFLDARGDMSRSPVFLRQQTRELMLEYGVELRPLQRKWQLPRRGQD